MKSCRILCVLTLLCLLLAACGSKAEADSGETVPVTTESAKDALVRLCVKTAREQTFRYTDKNGNTVSTLYRTPALCFETAEAKAINAEITERYEPLYDAAVEAAATYKNPDPQGIDYKGTVNDDVVSLVITRESDNHDLSYDVYNYNKTTGTRMDGAAVLAYLNREYDEILTTLQDALQADYTAKFSEEAFPDNYYDLFYYTLSEESLANAQFFLNEDAELYAICTEYADVGDGEFQVLLSLAT